jgi:putative transposase
VTGALRLAKCAEPLNIVWSRPLPVGAVPSSVTVSKDPAGRWHISILVETTVNPLPQTDRAVGIDVGLTSLVTLSTGEKTDNPKPEQRDRKRLAKAQRCLARKRKGSKNRAKARTWVAKIHARISDRRRDHPHKLTARLVQENQLVAVEDLSVSNLVRNHRLARSISDASWFELRRMLEYKCQWYGRTLVVADRWYPSSKLCSNCGYRLKSLSSVVRRWVCPGCGGVVGPEPVHRRGHTPPKQETPRATRGIPRIHP